MALRHRTVKLLQVLATDGRLTDGCAMVRRFVTRAFLSMRAAYESPEVPNIVESTEKSGR
jgi:hypothetical protein